MNKSTFDDSCYFSGDAFGTKDTFMNAHRGVGVGKGGQTEPPDKLKKLGNKNANKTQNRRPPPPPAIFLESLDPPPPREFGKNFSYPLPWIFNPCASMMITVRN
jgi:hypothetical protein